MPVVVGTDDSSCPSTAFFSAVSILVVVDVAIAAVALFQNSPSKSTSWLDPPKAFAHVNSEDSIGVAMLKSTGIDIKPNHSARLLSTLPSKKLNYTQARSIGENVNTATTYITSRTHARSYMANLQTSRQNEYKPGKAKEANYAGLSQVGGIPSLDWLIQYCSLVATCQRWRCWSGGCGFILMACPQILLLATFLLLLSFWTDLCHQASDDEEEDDDHSVSQSFLQKSNTQKHSLHVQARCCSFCKVRMGSRQKYVFLVILLTFLFMFAMALLIWFARGKNPLDPLLMSQVYLDVFSAFIIILGVALAFYGGILFSKMRNVRSEMASTEMWKVASLAAVSLICFTSSSALSLITSIPRLSYGHQGNFGCLKDSVFVCLYYVVGSSVPSSCVLWSMRELPSRHVTDRSPESRIITIVRDDPPTQPNPQWRTTVTNSQYKALKVSPI